MTSRTLENVATAVKQQYYFPETSTGGWLSLTCISVSSDAGAATALISCTSFCQPDPRTATSYTGSPSGRANASTI